MKYINRIKEYENLKISDQTREFLIRAQEQAAKSPGYPGTQDDEESWLDVLLQSGGAEKISSQKSSIINKDNGEVYEFLNRNFVEWIRRPENKEAHTYCKNKVKESLIIEQDPLKRIEEITTEELDNDEVL